MPGPGKVLIGCLAVAAAVAIATSASARRVKNDPRDGLSIWKGDSEFYLGRYVGRETDCFPPINRRVCNPLAVGEQIYALDRPLEMERFHIFIVASGRDHSAASV